MTSTRRTAQSLAHWGAFEAIVEDNRVTGVVPFSQDRQPALLLQSVPGAVHARCRIERPMVRAGWLQKRENSDREARGTDTFVEVSWEEATRLVAHEVQRVRGTFGNASIFNGSGGWASAGRFHHARTQLQRFLNLCGGYTYHVSNYSYGAGIILLPHLIGTLEPLTGPATDWRTIISDSQLIVSFGGMPLKNVQIESGGSGEHSSAAWMRKACDAGVDFVSVSPASSDMAEFLSADWISIRPNTDTALLLAIAYTLIDEGLHDRNWLDRYTVGFDQFESYVLGRNGSVPLTAEWASTICDISADTIRALARRMAARRTFINVSWSVQRGDHGEQPYWAAITVAAMLGGIGLPGRGFSFGFGSINRQGNPTPNIVPPKLPTGKNAVTSFVPAARFVDMLLNPGATLDFNGQKIVYPDIRLLYTCGGNPFHHQQDTNKVVRGLRCPETIITHEPWWTPAARHADIVLPATTTLERNDLGSGSLDAYVFAMKQAIPPLGMARNDHDIFADVAQELGLRAPFTEGRTEFEWLRYMYEGMRTAAATRDLQMPEFDAFWKIGHVHFPAAETPFVSFSAFRDDPEKNPLRTPSGKIEIVSQRIQLFGYDDCPGHAVWLEPAEWLGSRQADRYPIHLITNQPLHRLHSQLDMSSVSLAAKIKGREPILLHPADAAARGIKHGDVVRVFNDRGACLAGAVLTETIRERVAFLSTGAWYDPMEPGKDGSIDKHGSANMVTIDKGCSKLSQAPSAQSALVEIEPWHAPLPDIGIFDPPEISRNSVENDPSR